MFNTLSTLPAGAQTQLKDAGVDTLKLSAAFPRIRNNTKVYNTHLIHNQSSSADKTFNVASLYSTPMNLVDSTDFGLERASNVISAISLLNNKDTVVDKVSFNKFLNSQFNSSDESTLGSSFQGEGLTATKAELKDTSFLNRSKTDLFSTSNKLISSKERLNVSTLGDSEDKILQNDQTVQQQLVMNPKRSSPMFSSTKATLENSLQVPSTNRSATLLNTNVNFLDSGYVNSLSTRVFASNPLPPVTSTNPLRNKFGSSMFDGTILESTLNTTNEG